MYNKWKKTNLCWKNILNCNCRRLSLAIVGFKTENIYSTLLPFLSLHRNPGTQTPDQPLNKKPDTQNYLKKSNYIQLSSGNRTETDSRTSNVIIDRTISGSMNERKPHRSHSGKDEWSSYCYLDTRLIYQPSRSTPALHMSIGGCVFVCARARHTGTQTSRYPLDCATQEELYSNTLAPFDR